MTSLAPPTNNRGTQLLPPASYGTGATNGTGTSDHKGFYWGLISVNLGVLGTAATVDFKVQESAALGSGYTDVTGAAITQRVKATDDGKKALIALYLPARKDFLRGVLTIGAAASLVQVDMVFIGPRQGGAVDKAQTASETLSAPIGTGLGIGAGYDAVVIA